MLNSSKKIISRLKSFRNKLILLLIVLCIFISCTTETGSWYTTSSQNAFLSRDTITQNIKPLKHEIINYTFEESKSSQNSGRSIKVYLKESLSTEEWSEIEKNIQEKYNTTIVENRSNNTVVDPSFIKITSMGQIILGVVISLSNVANTSSLGVFGPLLIISSLGTMSLGYYNNYSIESRTRDEITTKESTATDISIKTNTKNFSNRNASGVTVYYDGFKNVKTDESGCATIPLPDNKTLSYDDLSNLYDSNPYSKLVKSSIAEEFKKLVLSKCKVSNEYITIRTSESTSTVRTVNNASKSVSYKAYTLLNSYFESAVFEFIDKYVNSQMVKVVIDRKTKDDNDTPLGDSYISSTSLEKEKVIGQYFTGTLAAYAYNDIKRYLTNKEEIVDDGDEYFILPDSVLTIKNDHTDYRNQSTKFLFPIKDRNMKLSASEIDTTDIYKIDLVFNKFPLTSQINEKYKEIVKNYVKKYKSETQYTIAFSNLPLRNDQDISDESYEVSIYTLTNEAYRKAVIDFTNDEIVSKIMPLYFSIKDELSRVPIKNVNLQIESDSPNRKKLVDRYFTKNLYEISLSVIPEYLSGKQEIYTGLGEIKIDLFRPTYILIDSSHPDYLYYSGNLRLGKEEKKTLYLVKIGTIVNLNPGEKTPGRIE